MNRITGYDILTDSLSHSRYKKNEQEETRANSSIHQR